MRKVWRQLRREGRDGRPGPGRAGHERPRPPAAFVGARPSAPRCRPTSALRPGDLVDRQLLRRRPQPLVARRHHLRLDLVGLLLHQLHHRRLRPAHRGLAGRRSRCAPTSPSTRSRWPSSAGATTTCPDLVHHSDRGVQYLAIRYTERLADEQAPSTSVGSKGDSYDNALAETVNGLYKTELIHRQGPWRTFEQLELATGGLGQLVERAAAPRGLWLRPAGGVRGELLPSLGRGQLGCVNLTAEPPSNPGRFTWRNSPTSGQFSLEMARYRGASRCPTLDGASRMPIPRSSPWIRR